MIEDIKSLPPLPASISKIQELCMMSEVDVNALAKVIESDPMLSANILKAANSPLYGMSREISSIHQAMMLFGISMIRGFAAANAIKKTLPLDMSPYNTTIEHLSEVSMMQQALVRLWYGEADKSMLPLLMSASFLMELGKLVGAAKIIKMGQEKLFASQIEESENIAEIEKIFFGMDSYEISALMFEHWHFESHLIDIFRAISDSEPQGYGAVLNVVSQAISLKEVLSEKSIERALGSIEKFGLPLAEFEKAVAMLKENIQK
ncbi:MAG: HDOD domain-containing protein [Sulfuricurvum sp.]|uniref:HDOD domain-containing protein n=1 Tax=Sulfuricurvum sp. TaxID=2025608 RepID=UPI002636631D|nr:HDOD domain-containing protein [Sulfuricurvum sp.]MDD2828377.1 HDOD domain-containing protein [Sulfuricurvum sp.]MDD4949382.1 HDOD domain-containing protein [Sulfuricurvum sp.]